MRLEPVDSGENYLVFETPDLPIAMEAHLTLYDVQHHRKGKIRARVGDRQVKASFEEGKGDRLTFRFRFRFARGRNQVRLEILEGRADLSKASFGLARAIVPERLWSYPIIRGDIHHPEWIEITRNNLVRVCREYDVDIPYIDAVAIWRAHDWPIFHAIQDGLPGRVFGCEYPSELTYKMFRLCGTAFKRLPTNEEAGYVVSDFSAKITRRFARMFSAGRFYASAGSGLNSQMGALEAVDQARRAEAEQHMKECRGMGVIPGIRLNYRDHGLDEMAKQVMLDALKW